MKYTLILPTGKVMCFFVLSVAQLYQSLYRGVLITESVLEQESLPVEMENR